MQSELFKLFKVKEQIKQNNCFLSVPGVILRSKLFALSATEIIVQVLLLLLLF